MRNCVRVAQQTLTLFVWVRILVPQPFFYDLSYNVCTLTKLIFEVWLSLVERYVRDVEVAGSNPVTSTTILKKLCVIFYTHFFISNYFLGERL